MKNYERVAESLRQRVDRGVYRVGDRLPSIRTLCDEFGVSISTVQGAYARLEEAGLVEARPKSGYYVLPRNAPPVMPTVARPAQRPLDVSDWSQVFDLIAEANGEDPLSLGRGIPELRVPTLKPLYRRLSERYRHGHAAGLGYGALVGSVELREQIVHRAAVSGCLLHPDDVLVTTACHEALNLALRTLAEPGDVVAVDSPSFYGTMHMLRAQKVKVVEIPTDPQTGISLEALELALEQWPIKAIQVTPTCNNPLGYTMPEANKRALVTLAQRFDVAIIEDDIYGDLSYDMPRPKMIKSFDDDGRVLLCSSVSKTLTPELRLGWIAPGRYRDRVTHLKYVSTGPSATLPQRAVADFMAKGHYELHLRAMVRQYRSNRDVFLDWVQRYFPAQTGVSYPQGGFLLWLELPADADCVRLNEELLDTGIRIAPGSMFSASGKYRNCMRLNYAAYPSPRVERALRVIGERAAAAVDEVTAA